MVSWVDHNYTKKEERRALIELLAQTRTYIYLLLSLIVLTLLTYLCMCHNASEEQQKFCTPSKVYRFCHHSNNLSIACNSSCISQTSITEYEQIITHDIEVVKVTNEENAIVEEIWKHVDINGNVILLLSSNQDDQKQQTYIEFERNITSTLLDKITDAFLADPHDTTADNPYYNFFRAHDVSLWTIDMNAHVASPLQLDVVYTYVNPSAPSFARHATERKLNIYESKRFRDWEELRYSLRALQAYALDSEALRQYHNKYAEDVELLTSLGFRVEQNTTTNINIDNINIDSIVSNGSKDVTDSNVDDSRVNKIDYSLIRRIYLVLSAVDQIPDWLNVSEFAMLHVVTHSELFTTEEQMYALPSFNSLSIESTLHRIPNLSTFFWYFNDDMLLGRKLSLFDLFKPMSYERQQLYWTYLHYTRVNDDHTTRKSPSEEKEHFTFPHLTHCTFNVIFMEPIYSVDDTISTTQEFVPSEEVIVEETKIADEHAMTDSDSNSSVHKTMSKQEKFLSVIKSIKEILFWQSSPHRSYYWRDNLDMTNSRLVSGKFTHTNVTGAYAHKPLLIHQKMFNLLTESRGIGFQEEMNALRHTYSRAQSQTSAVHLYTPYMQIYQQYVNSVLYELYNTSIEKKNHEEVIEEYEQYEQKKNIELFSVNNDAAANVDDAYKAVQTELLSSIGKLTIQDEQTTIKPVNVLWKYAQERLHYIGNTIKCRVCSIVATFVSSLICENDTLQNEQTIKLHKLNMLTKDYAVEDADNHEYWFVMLDSEVKSLLSLTRAVDIAQRGKCPLFVTINDDLPNTNVIRTKT